MLTYGHGRYDISSDTRDMNSDDAINNKNNNKRGGGQTSRLIGGLLARLLTYITLYTRKMVTIKKRAGVIPYIFSSSIALLSSLLSCSFYLLDLKTISSVNILEMT